MHSIPVPAPLFGPLLEEIDDLDEFKCTMRLVWLLQQKKGYPRFVTIEEVFADRVLATALSLEGRPDQGRVEAALSRAVGRGTLTTATVDQSGKKPPVVHDLAKALRMQVKDIERSLKAFIRHGLIVRVVKNRYFLVATVRELGLDVIAVVDKSEHKEFTASEYRDRTAVGRNLAIEILEYFDRIGFTRRIGDKRIVAKDVDEVF